jgi:1-acyl-sn-glycerol-3-phosphate acyltransferase
VIQPLRKRPNSREPEKRIPVQLLRASNLIFARVYHNLTVLKPCTIPRRGPAILVCNHTSSIDPVFLQSVCPHRMITWMMAKEYLDTPGMGWLFRTVGIIPVDRNGRDTSSLRAALRALDAGRVLGVFPEGRIETDRELLPFQTGVAMMAMKTHVPVFPAYLDGTQRGKEMVGAALVPNRAILTFGPPIEFDRTKSNKIHLDQATAQIKSAVAALRDSVCPRNGHPVER